MGSVCFVALGNNARNEQFDYQESIVHNELPRMKGAFSEEIS